MKQKMGRIILNSSPLWAKTGFVIKNGEQESGRFILAAQLCLGDFRVTGIKCPGKALFETQSISKFSLNINP